ncbi:hypothetical protein LSAT2_006998 [Lamellibrachia satsuma]|nr:hypothetical protein LSAT2_006998 [Lamellibrachia satsuma]
MLDVSASQEVWDGKSIEVHGLKSSTTHDTVELFFEDFRRSGGGSLEYVHIDMENNVAHLVFEQPEVAERVLTKPNLLLEGATLTVYQHLLVTEWHQRKMVKNKDGRDHVIQEPAVPVVDDRRGLTPNNIVPMQDVWDGKTIKVHGYDPSAHEDTILMFFESKRRSDGGPVERVHLDTDNYMAYVTFVNTEDAQRVLRHGHLLLAGATLTVQKVMSEESRQRETATESHDNAGV